MNKIYNNLNIENLIKTDWFEQFYEKQKEVIIIGLEQNLDVSIYAKTEYEWEQMEEIREGLENNLDISLYATPEVSTLKMEEIRLKLLRESTLK